MGMLTTRQGPKDAFGGRVRKIGYDKQGERAKIKRNKTTVQTHPHEREAERWRGNITKGGRQGKTRGTETMGARESPHLIHMLAKHATPMTASSTTLGRVPAKLSTRVINTRSMFVFESAAAIVNPPMSSMMVGENITENTQLRDP